MKLCVLILRGLGASHIGPYGNRWVDTPSLNALAAQAVVFETHLATHPDDPSARFVWRTGRHRFPAPGPTPAGDAPDLLAALRAAGVSTRLLLDSSRPTPPDFEAGWDVVGHAAGLDAAVTLGKEALAELSRSEKGLLWIELASLVPPWDVKEEFITPYFTSPSGADDESEGEEDEGASVEDEPLEPLFDPPAGPVDPEDDLLFEVIQTTYGAAISQLDSALAELLDGLPDDVALLVTSDHGQALGEHGVVGPVRPYLHREIVQVPLILRLPGRTARRRAAGLTLSVDLAPTIAELFGLGLKQSHGRSLIPLTGLTAAVWREYACMGARVGDEIEWAMWTDEWSLRLPLDGSDPRLYVRPDDRTEINDVQQHRIEETDALVRTLRAYVAACDQPGPFAPPPLERPAEAPAADA